MISATELDMSHHMKPPRSTTDRRIGSKSKVGGVRTMVSFPHICTHVWLLECLSTTMVGG